jgi:transposase
MEEVDEQDLHVERIAALDLGKAVLEACVRVPHESRPGRRLQEVRGYATTTSALLALADWLHSWGVTRVVMESTSNYWKGVVRHEAPCVRAEVKGLRLRPVAAGR